MQSISYVSHIYDTADDIVLEVFIKFLLQDYEERGLLRAF